MASSQGFPFDDSVAFQAVVKLVAGRFQVEGQAAADSQPQFEEELHTAMEALERDIHTKDFERMDLDVPGVVIGGKRYVAKEKTPGEYTTSAGVIHPLRMTYRERGGHGGETVVPLELRLGLVGGNWTPRAAQLGGAFMAALPSAKAAGLLKQLGGMAPSASHLDRLPKLLNEVWESDRERLEAAVREAEESRLPAKEAVAGIMVSLDGILVPMKDAPREPGLGKEDVGPKGYKEVGCGTVSLLDAQGKRLQTLYLARMPEEKKATLKGELTAEVKHLHAYYSEAKLHGMADGAEDNWTYLVGLGKELGVEMSQLADYFHAAEHLNKGILRYYGPKDKDEGRETARHFREVLRDEKGGVHRVIAALKYRVEHSTGERRDDIEKELNYFRNHVELMNYPRANKAHLPIGSGIMEAACKTLAGQRMKQSGMTWREPGGQGILTLRALDQSGRLSDAWGVWLPLFKQEVTIDANQDRKKPERRAA